MALKNQTSGDAIFMQGKYISMAVGNKGAVGTSTATPAGFNSYTKGEVTNLGMYVDVDGFGTGAASTFQDTVAMGAVIERFNVGYNIGGTRHIDGNTQFGTSTIGGGTATNLSDASAARAGWTGTTDEKLKINQIMTLTDDAKYIKVEITLTNQSSTTMADVRYMRSVDPDHDTSYTNLIKVVEQGGDGSKGALIAAYQPNGKNPFFYYTPDDRAKVSTYNMINRDPYADRAYASAQAEGYSVTADQAINITFAAGTLAAGQSTKLVFYMGLTDNLDATLAEINGGVVPVDLAPVTAADAFTTTIDKALSGNVLTNDIDPEGKALTAKIVSGPQNGTVALAADGSFLYTPKAGFTGVDVFNYSASDGTSSASAAVAITVAPKPNTAPVAVADNAGTVEAGSSVAGNVLVNDRDADGNALTAKLVAQAAHGTVTLAADGSFVYAAAAGYEGSDTFTYAASDGKASSTATVTVDVKAPETQIPAIDKLLAAHKAVDGSAASADTLSGPSGHNAFYIDSIGVSGKDVIANLEGSDVLILSKALADSDGNNSIGIGSGRVFLDGTSKGDVLTIAGVTSLRYLGEAVDGAHVYADSAVKPRNAIESRLGDDVLSGDATDRKANKFFFDTGLGFDLGNDTINSMGKRDIIVTTTALDDGDGDGIVGFGGDASLTLTGVAGIAGDGGELSVFDTAGAAVNALEFDGSVLQDGVTYYVYSLVGSAGGVGTLGF